VQSVEPAELLVELLVLLLTGTYLVLEAVEGRWALGHASLAVEEVLLLPQVLLLVGRRTLLLERGPLDHLEVEVVGPCCCFNAWGWLL